jgi:hypothetical protein
MHTPYFIFNAPKGEKMNKTWNLGPTESVPNAEVSLFQGVNL